MWKKMSNENLLFYKNTNSLNPSLLLFDFPTLIGKMKLKHTWVKGDLETMILLKIPTKQIVLTALHEGTEIQSFQSNESITFQVIEGKMQFHSRKGSVNLDKGQLLTLSENINYRLTTNVETVLLLTITSGSIQLSEN
jgi:quercetin dioxygenase-like cupin family protein